MKMKQFFRMLLVGVTSIVTLAGCDGVENSSEWNYTKEDLSEAIVRPVTSIEKYDDVFYTFTFKDSEFNFFNAPLAQEDIVFFNQTVLENDPEIKDLDFIDYNTLKSHETFTRNFIEIDNTGFSLQFPCVGDHRYGALINKGKNKLGKYMIISNDIPQAVAVRNEEIRVFQTKYFETPEPAYDKAKTVLRICECLSSLFLSGDAGSQVAGFFGIIGCIFDFLKIKNGVTLVDVMNKLIDMDKKLDYISSIINENAARIGKQVTLAQIGIDKEIYEQLTTRIQLFNDLYLKDLNGYIRTLEIQCMDYLKNEINNPREISIFYKKEADGKCKLYSAYEEHDGATELKMTPTYRRTAAYLKEHSQVLGEDYQKEMFMDLYDSVNANALSFEGKTKEQIANDFIAQIVERFFFETYQNNSAEAAKLLNLVIPMLERMAPGITPSIVDDLTERLTYVFNFGTEVKQLLVDTYGSLLIMIDKFTALASEACSFAKVSQAELGDKYLLARRYILQAKDKALKIDPNYSYVEKCNINGKLLHIFTTTKFDFSQGSIGLFQPTLHIENETYDPTRSAVSSAEFKRNEAAVIESSSISIMASRHRLLYETGRASDSVFFSYLSKLGILDKGSEGRIFNLGAYNTISFVGKLGTRLLTDDDKNLELICDSKGYDSKRVYYFNLNQKYKFRGAHGDKYWKGTAYVSQKTSGINGEMLNPKDDVVTAFAHYYEKGGWSIPESWGFSHNTGYYLSLSRI